MLNVKVLGAGCANCKRLEQTVRRVAEANGLALDIEKITDYEQIMTWNILKTPGLVVAGKLVAAGRIPGDPEILRLLTA